MNVDTDTQVGPFGKQLAALLAERIREEVAKFPADETERAGMLQLIREALADDD